MTDLLKQAVEKIKGKRVLVAPLNWGLGHATRCVPIIKALLQEGKEVMIAADGVALDFLQQEFPTLPCQQLKGIHIKYSSGNSQVKSMLSQLPDLIESIKVEHKAIRQIVKEQHIDAVISDNRFGLWCNQCESIYITHQLMVKMTPMSRWLNRVAWLLHRYFINRYDRCWIPDLEGSSNLAGDLTHHYKLPRNAEFIGVLSRFEPSESTNDAPRYDTVVLISGPEPQRSLFEERTIHHFSKSTSKTLILRGQPHQNITPLHINNITLVNHLPTTDLQAILSNTPHLVCRSGYSSLMDLYTLQKKATLVPTPGQTEQEYLSSYWKTKGYEVIPQDQW